MFKYMFSTINKVMGDKQKSKYTKIFKMEDGSTISITRNDREPTSKDAEKAKLDFEKGMKHLEGGMKHLEKSMNDMSKELDDMFGD